MNKEILFKKIKNNDYFLIRPRILGCSEARWSNSGKIIPDQHQIYYSGDNKTKNRNGVAIIIRKKLDGAVIGFLPISDRLALLKMEAEPNNLTILQVYAPTSNFTEQETELLNEELKNAYKNMKTEVNITMGHFNAKIVTGSVEDIIGEYGIGTTNNRGEKLIDYCQETENVVTNIHFKLPARRLYTCRSPADSLAEIIRNQID